MKTGKIHIAVVEDDDTIRSLLTENLRTANFAVSAYFTAEQFERKHDESQDLLLLDIMLPGKSGLTLLKELRTAGRRIPVILITASDSEAHKNLAFDMGAIDYIVKPFRTKHLIQKIENLLSQFKATARSTKTSVSVGEASFEPALSMVLRGNKEAILTPSEAKTLIFFLENSNRVISREELQKAIGGESAQQSSRNLDNYILKFRRLFERDAKAPEYFITIPRKGYALKR